MAITNIFISCLSNISRDVHTKKKWKKCPAAGI